MRFHFVDSTEACDSYHLTCGKKPVSRISMGFLPSKQPNQITGSPKRQASHFTSYIPITKTTDLVSDRWFFHRITNYPMIECFIRVRKIGVSLLGPVYGERGWDVWAKSQHCLSLSSQPSALVWIGGMTTDPSIEANSLPHWIDHM